MATVKELQNAIRAGVGRFERDVSAQFTKEELAAVAEAVGYTEGAASKAEWRKGIRVAVGVSESFEDAPDAGFRKEDLVAIADYLDVEP